MSRSRNLYLGVLLVFAVLAASVTFYLVTRGGQEAEQALPAASVAAAPAAPTAAPAEPEPVEVVEEPEPEAPPVVEAPPVQVAYTPPTPPPPPQAAALRDAGKWGDARAAVAARFGKPLSDREREELSAIGIAANRRLLIESPDPNEVIAYEIRSGDSLERIARKHKDLNGVKGSVMLLNGYTEKTVLRVGRKVRIPKGTWSILVDKSLFKLYLLYEGAPFKTYTIAIGKDDKTPTANFTVGVKNPKPKWYPPNDFHRRGPIPYGDPENPLGEYWVGLEHNFHQGFGIHGTNEPETLGQKASNGCIRMDNKEILEIAAVSFKGMQVAFVD